MPKPDGPEPPPHIHVDQAHHPLHPIHQYDPFPRTRSIGPMSDLASVKPTDTPPADPPRKTNWIPSRKAISGGIGGVVSYLIIVAAGQFGYPIPVELQGLIPGAITWALYYLVPSSQQDVIRNLDNKIVAMAVNDPDSPVTQNKIAAAVRAEPIPTLSPNDPRL